MLRIKKAFYDLSDQTLFWSFAVLCLAFCLAGIAISSPLPALIPVGIIFSLFVVNSPKQLFYLFFALLPFSIEIHVGSFGTDLPSEPLMILLMGICLIMILRDNKSISNSNFLHPISIILFCHLAWIAFTGIFSSDQIVSFKYLLAKLWYVIPFFFLPQILFKKEDGFRKIFIVLSITMFVAITYTMVRHAAAGFTFASSNKVMRPIFRNHVNYAIMLLAFLPYYWYLIRTTSSKMKVVLFALLAYLLVAIYFSYTRAAQASVLLAVAFYWVVKWRLVKVAIGLSLVGLLGIALFMSTNNKYLDYAPDFDKTIAHKNFNNILEATSKMEDISTVERFYRWVAGGYMVAEKPLLGFGPATFYFQYRAHTVTSYKTYVSDNPEKSGIHNNYLMIAVEQGIPGLLIFLSFTFLPLLYVEKLFHKLSDNRDRALVFAAGTCFFLISVTILINDLIEADKIGPLYFLSAGLVVFYDVRSRRVEDYV